MPSHTSELFPRSSASVSNRCASFEESSCEPSLVAYSQLPYRGSTRDDEPRRSQRQRISNGAPPITTLAFNLSTVTYGDLQSSERSANAALRRSSPSARKEPRSAVAAQPLTQLDGPLTAGCTLSMLQYCTANPVNLARKQRRTVLGNEAASGTIQAASKGAEPSWLEGAGIPVDSPT